MVTDTVNRPPDVESPASRNVAWALLPRRRSSGCNLTIVVQRFAPGGDFEAHRHDLEQYFYVTRGRLEMTIGDQTRVYGAGDFVSVERNVLHAGRNVAEGTSELLVVDYWPADSEDRIGLG
ncbi:MAG: cupin domain-containing protein [Candidatus Latescibacterota bacterium]